jgi:hypothetical protein
VLAIREHPVAPVPADPLIVLPQVEEPVADRPLGAELLIGIPANPHPAFLEEVVPALVAGERDLVPGAVDPVVLLEVVAGARDKVGRVRLPIARRVRHAEQDAGLRVDVEATVVEKERFFGDGAPPPALALGGPAALQDDVELDHPQDVIAQVGLHGTAGGGAGADLREDVVPVPAEPLLQEAPQRAEQVGLLLAVVTVPAVAGGRFAAGGLVERPPVPALAVPLRVVALGAAPPRPLDDHLVHVPAHRRTS